LEKRNFYRALPEVQPVADAAVPITHPTVLRFCLELDAPSAFNRDLTCH
jgi:hypothetical protein